MSEYWRPIPGRWRKWWAVYPVKLTNGNIAWGRVIFWRFADLYEPISWRKGFWLWKLEYAEPFEALLDELP